MTNRTVSRFFASAFVSLCCITVSNNAFAQEIGKVKIQQLPQESANVVASRKTALEAGLAVTAQKKRVSLETEIQYLKEHPEAAFILPSDTQERIKQGLPVQNIKVSIADLEQQANTQKARK